MTIYRERVWASAWVFVATALVIPASVLVFLPINPIVGVIVAVVLYAACVGILLATAPVIEVTDSQFIAGRAQLPVRFIGDVAAFSGEEATLQRGQKLDARAWLMIRGWVDPIVKVDLTDPEDPTPYWVVSTRQPGAVLEAIAKAQALA